VIFIDRSVPKSVSEALKQVRDDVIWLEDRYSHDAADALWLRDAGLSGWIVISRDKGIRTRPGERELLREHSVGAFILTQKRNPNRWEYLRLLCKTIDEMEQRFAATPRPFIFGVNAAGQFRQIL
jgi:hypothetical protein